MWRDGSPVRPTGGNGAGEGGQAEALSEGDVIMEIVLMVMTVMMGMMILMMMVIMLMMLIMMVIMKMMKMDLMTEGSFV